MTKEFTDVYCDAIVNSYKVSANYRTKTLRVYILDRRRFVYYKHVKASSLSVKEIDNVMFDMTYNDFRQFMLSDNRFSIWQ